MNEDVVINVVKNLSGTPSIEDIKYHLKLVSEVMGGLNDEANGKMKTTSEVLEAINKLSLQK